MAGHSTAHRQAGREHKESLFYRTATPLPPYPTQPNSRTSQCGNPSPQKNSLFTLSTESCNHPLEICVIVFCDQLFGNSELLNHPLLSTGVDGILEFEFWDNGVGVAIILEGYFVCGLDG